MRLDYYLVSRNTKRYITNAYIGWANALSDHRLIFVTITPATLPKGGGFWKFENLLLRDTDFVTGLNQMIKTVMKRYSHQLQEIDD